MPLTNGMAVAPVHLVNLRPEIVLPPGFSLRIDYDPARSPASLTVTAFQDDTPVGQAHLNPREVGLRLRLEVKRDDATPAAEPAQREPRLRLTPRNAALAIEMEAIPPSATPTEDARAAEPEPSATSAPVPSPPTVAEATSHPGMEELYCMARDAAPDSWRRDEWNRHTAPLHASNALVWLENGSAVVLPSVSAPDVEGMRSRVMDALRALTVLATELLSSPLRPRVLDPPGLASSRAS